MADKIDKHNHYCPSKLHGTDEGGQGSRTTVHYDHYCTEPYRTPCMECGDAEWEAVGAVMVAGPADGPSDAAPGL